MSTLSLNHKEALQSAYKHTQFVTVLPSIYTQVLQMVGIWLEPASPKNKKG